MERIKRKINAVMRSYLRRANLSNGLDQHQFVFNEFTSHAFTQTLKDKDIWISMDGKGSWRDNVFVERLWRSVKYEKVYLHASESVSAARSGLGGYFDFYNHRRPHSRLD